MLLEPSDIRLLHAVCRKSYPLLEFNRESLPLNDTGYAVGIQIFFNAKNMTLSVRPVRHKCCVFCVLCFLHGPWLWLFADCHLCCCADH